MKKRTKIIILVAMVLLLGVTAYLNIVLNDNVIDTSTQTSANYFDSYRTTRQSSRNQEIAYYDAIIASNSSAEAVATAEAKKVEVIAMMEKELVMEGLIKSKGFLDVIVTNSASNIYVSVKATELTRTEVAQIVAIVQEQTNKSIENIKIIPIE